MAQVNSAIMAGVVEAAKASVLARKFDAKKEGRWIRAIDNAVESLDSNPWISLRPDGVLVWASENNPEVYEVSERGCHCEAARLNTPCRHVCARKLLINYEKALAFPIVPSRIPQVTFEGAQPKSAPFKFRSNDQGERWGGMQI